MKTFVPSKQNILKAVLFILVSASGITSQAQSSTGFAFDNVSVNSGSTSTNGTVNLLPDVNQTSFTVMLNNESKVDLKWSTATEINLSHFMVERSTDGINFSDAALVFAYGNTTSRSDYAFRDNISNIQSDVVYYRLRYVNVDGKNQNSEVRSLRIGKQADDNNSIVTYPNPVSKEVFINIPANWQNKKVGYEIVSENGQTAKKIEVGNSSETESIKVSNIAPGFYIVKVTCDGVTAQQKIVKQ